MGIRIFDWYFTLSLGTYGRPYVLRVGEGGGACGSHTVGVREGGGGQNDPKVIRTDYVNGSKVHI